jgi:hypothetical protein
MGTGAGGEGWRDHRQDQRKVDPGEQSRRHKTPHKGDVTPTEVRK